MALWKFTEMIQEAEPHLSEDKILEHLIGTLCAFQNPNDSAPYTVYSIVGGSRLSALR